MKLDSVVRASWDGGGGLGSALLSLVTTPLSWIWGGVTAVRNRRHDRRPPEPVPGLGVISVGNLAVGGTGKTPMARWVVDVLRDGAVPCAVVLSGYGEDEVLLHRRWHPDVPVFAGPDRSALLREARDGGAVVAVLDDGFQHRGAPRDLDMVLVAAEHRFPGRVMPRGRYREPPASLARADLVVITRRTADDARVRAHQEEVARQAPSCVTACATLTPDRWLDVHGRAASPPEGPLLALASVARPEGFVEAVRVALPGTDVVLRAFPDHHAYSEQDVRRAIREAPDRTVVATEKDAVKLEPLSATPPDTRILSSRISWDLGEAEVRAAIEAVARGVTSSSP
ncbi:MAG: tetraacyldisaccharide 4'-kinase [Gemmatimonadota bacterium]